MKFFSMILIAILWGILSALMVPYPISIIISIIGGGIIGLLLLLVTIILVLVGILIFHKPEVKPKFYDKHIN